MFLEIRIFANVTNFASNLKFLCEVISKIEIKNN